MDLSAGFLLSLGIWLLLTEGMLPTLEASTSRNAFCGAGDLVRRSDSRENSGG